MEKEESKCSIISSFDEARETIVTMQWKYSPETLIVLTKTDTRNEPKEEEEK